MELGQRLKQARLEARLSQRQLCGEEITRNMLSQIENGSAKPSMDTLRFLAARLGKPVSYFLEEDVASPNQRLMAAARAEFSQSQPAAALEILSKFLLPDPVLEAEFHLLTALCCMALAETTPQEASLLLHRAGEAGQKTPYFPPALERQRLLLLAQAVPEKRSSVLQILAPDDRELLLRARDSLENGDPNRCIALLEAAARKDSVQWLLLRGNAAEAVQAPGMAITYYTQAEALVPQQVYPRLEQCYLQLGDYKMAYHYACKQRS